MTDSLQATYATLILINLLILSYRFLSTLSSKQSPIISYQMSNTFSDSEILTSSAAKQATTCHPS